MSNQEKIDAHYRNMEEFRAMVARTQANIAACERIIGAPLTNSQQTAVSLMVSHQIRKEKEFSSRGN